MPYPESVSFGSIVTVISNQCGPAILFNATGKSLNEDTGLRTYFHVISRFLRLVQSSNIKTPVLANRYRARTFCT